MANIFPTRRTQRGLGSSDTALLEQLFPARSNGPLSLSGYDIDSVHKKLVDGVVNGNPDVPNFSLDYSDAPEITDFHPNPASPSVLGSIDPADKPPLPSGVSFPQSGMGSVESPNQTSLAISKQDPSNLPDLGESGASAPGHPGQ